MVRPSDHSGAKLMPPKEHASDSLISNMEADIGSWSGLDETGPDKVGVGLFFTCHGEDGAHRMSSMVPGSSAHLSGLLLVGDKILSVDNEAVYGLTLVQLRQRIHGVPGTFVTLDMERELQDGEKKMYRVNCMRGSPQFIAYQDRYGVANASRLDELVLQKREEQKFNSLVEKQLRIEQAKFAAAQQRRKDLEKGERNMREELEQLQKELYMEEQLMHKATEQFGYYEMTVAAEAASNAEDAFHQMQHGFGDFFHTTEHERGEGHDAEQHDAPVSLPSLFGDLVVNPIASLFSQTEQGAQSLFSPSTQQA
mmetsp:Transcript_4558/g.8945  ORF Transcript_4558/g.8945 Transcript_4558/m.8945 type:complete len:310 (-) Transcript_4558:117-1046(-)|eukprot:CAMPEP_0173404580 /NCGR_PEP_ID=MMETSP1356-20130122/59739_1 /TAXON_ID=77927 ORGANISM="Hemiselmis virescens, Strain PCC157" /NCGR_SAMPLE_ID=MMETSP1356 /ASSEMBLY_ACC=CAM_ASM_000847 /LENGTH=309 /DNA_ID=CAMNT_0014365279 /DNA_START=148 /DNA_END=1077 /DNA_ORIENTATION=+